jgi:tungstate transport system permease protein
MQSFTQSLHEAVRLVVAFDGDLREIILLSLQVSLFAVGIAALIGLPLGAFLAMSRFRFRQVVITVDGFTTGSGWLNRLFIVVQ